MSGAARPILLGAGPVRLLGLGLLAAGLVLPWLILAWRAAEPPGAAAVQEPVTLRPEMVALPAGSFRMGSAVEEEGLDDDERLHEVTLSRPFMLARTEVTQGQFEAVMGAGSLRRGDADFGGSCEAAGVGPALPAVCVTWTEAVAFCNRLSGLEGLEPAYDIQGDAVRWDAAADGYRLPTEAEWEHAARAGTQTPWVGTDDPGRVCDYANVADRSAKRENAHWETFDCDDGHPRLAPVTAREVNPWHLHGMGGNAAEWVWDWYGDYPETTVEDPVGPGSGSGRVIRGGSWWSGPRFARVAFRGGVAPESRDVIVGFRLARSCPSASLPSDCLRTRP